MERLSGATRSANLEQMAAEQVDILVVGGGVTGAGSALDAAARGYRVALVERADFASGTSSKSTKLVHGGIRYLPQFDFALVREALVERGLLIRNAPYLVAPIGFVLPLYADAKRPLGIPFAPPKRIGLGLMLMAGLFMYDTMSGRLGIRRFRPITVRQTRKVAPCLRTEGLKQSFVYYDAQTDDTRLTTTLIRTAALHGALVANYAEVTAFRMDGDRVVGATVRDHLSGREYQVNARYVINAGGVFAERIARLTGREAPISVEPAKGVHITVPREAVKLGKDAIVLPETEDGRLLFLVPWGARVTIGTTDTEGGDIEHPLASGDDVEYLLRHVNRYMSCQLTRKDIISVWAGYRPLVRAKEAAASSKLSRTHAVVDGPEGMVSIIGGKLTTYRRMAQDVVDHIDKLDGNPSAHITEHLALSGAKGWEQAQTKAQQLGNALGLAADILKRLNLYGANQLTLLNLAAREPQLAARIVPDLPYILAEVIYACRYEMALTLDDVLARRTRILLEDWAQGMDAAPTVARLMAAELGWDDAERDRQIAKYQQVVEAQKAEIPAAAPKAGKPAPDAVGEGELIRR